MVGRLAERYMRRALSLAERGKGRTSPNPLVGAVLVKGGRVIGEGYHRFVGGDHAERIAIRRAGAASRRATLYVTLEPCCHQGRTGACTDAIIEAGIRRVVFAVRDPDPRVNGRGARMLRRAGIEVENGLLKQAAAGLNEAYLHSVKLGRPFVILKLAQTLDGRIATVSGDSRWISGRRSRTFAHRLRAESDAVVVGMQTVRRDNPSLTVRHVSGVSPYRIVLSNSLKFPRRCQLLDDNTDNRTIVATSAESRRRLQQKQLTRGKNLIFWDIMLDRIGLLDLNDFVKKAADFGLRSLLVEGGAHLATSFLRAGLVDKFVAIIAPKLIGSGVETVGELGIRQLRDAIEFERTSIESSGSDTVFIGYPRKVR